MFLGVDTAYKHLEYMYVCWMVYDAEVIKYGHKLDIEDSEQSFMQVMVQVCLLQSMVLHI